MSELPGNSYPVESLNPEALQTAQEQNLAEVDRRSRTRIFTIEQTKEFPTSIAISYGGLNQSLPLTVKDKLKPGTKILVVQQSELEFSPIEGVYVLGENLKEIPIQNQSQPEPPQ